MCTRFWALGLLAGMLGCATAAKAPSPQAPPRDEEGPRAPELSDSLGEMWLPGQLEGPEHRQRLKNAGVDLDQLSMSDLNAFPLSAIVDLDGCSASFVSSEGLILTNHHCVQAALQYNSEPGRDLLEQGFYARRPQDERWCGPNARAYLVRRSRDVTAAMLKNLDRIQDDAERAKAVASREKKLVAQCESRSPFLRCTLLTYDGGNQYHLVEQTPIEDLRLVFVPPRSVGAFGGEVDNWQWPRHAGDFALLRAYVDAQGQPAAHRKDNVAFRPPHFLRPAKTALNTGDFVMVAGFPGRTYRLRSYDELHETMSWRYPRQVAMYREYLAAIGEVAQKGEALRQSSDPLRLSLENSLKYTEGALQALHRGSELERRRKFEESLRAWVHRTESRREAYGEVFREMVQTFAQRRTMREHDAALNELPAFVSLLDAALTIVRMAEERAKPDAERDPRYQKRNWKHLEAELDGLEGSYAREVDIELAATALQRLSHLPENLRPAFLRQWFGTVMLRPSAARAKLRALYGQSGLESAEERRRLFRSASVRTLRSSRDPLIEWAVALLPLLRAIESRDEAYRGRMLLLRPRYVEALYRFVGKPVAPDANGSLRISYGRVQGYRPDASMPAYEAFTWAEQLLEKSTGAYPFDSPQALLKALRNGDFGPYRVEGQNSLPIDFLSTVDITGGNSGSPTLNARGELVGVAFDGNYEALASDWVYQPRISRAIHVDLRYLLWYLSRVQKAERVINELGVR